MSILEDDRAPSTEFNDCFSSANHSNSITLPTMIFIQRVQNKPARKTDWARSPLEWVYKYDWGMCVKALPERVAKLMLGCSYL